MTTNPTLPSDPQPPKTVTLAHWIFIGMAITSGLLVFFQTLPKDIAWLSAASMYASAALAGLGITWNFLKNKESNRD